RRAAQPTRRAPAAGGKDMIPIGSAVATRLLLCGARTALAAGLIALGLEGLHLLLDPEALHLA
ncbi:MAG: hypothetical protein ACK512_05835, partial [Cyanobium sp.]